MIEQIIERLNACADIEALALGGSRATKTHDASSDYDFYVYLYNDIPEEKRRELLDPFVKYMEYSNRFWELEDDGTLHNGIDIEFIYRKMEDIDQGLHNLVINKQVSHGYSTCFLDNVLQSKIVFDKDNRLQELKDTYRSLVDSALYDAIIDYNVPILMDKMPSLYYQIEKAVKRHDVFSVNHRSTAYFELYFDILYAINKVTHPGEKRLLTSASTLPVLPENIVSDITTYFDELGRDNVTALSLLKTITERLYTVLEQQGYHYPINSYKETL